MVDKLLLKLKIEDPLRVDKNNTKKLSETINT